jgi:hypothetical protein
MRNCNRRLLNVLFLLLIVFFASSNAFWSTKKEEKKIEEVKTPPEPEPESEIVNDIPSVNEEQQTFEEEAPNEIIPEEEFQGEEEEFQGEEEFFEGDVIEGRTDLHIAAAEGLYDVCAAILGDEGYQSDILHARDTNGWQAIHEASRAGHTEIVKLFADRGADIGAVTNTNDTPLSVARSSLDEGHETIRFLEEMGAPDAQIPPAE